MIITALFLVPKIVRSKVLRESFDREFEVMEDDSIAKLRAELNTQDVKKITIERSICIHTLI